jgi:tRNA pseudouridine32 synthase/23S rRNA pseudouridine746 synthase/23S rRNA pseudouridine1911/1915/1917 synthase
MIKSKIKIRSKYVPEGIKILYEDRDIIVIDKSSGLLSVKARYEKEKTAHQLLINYVRKGNPKAKTNLFVVHRLDRETSGVMVFTKSYELREKFAAQWKNVEKKYLAVVQGNLAGKSGIIESYLAEKDDYMMSSVKIPEEGKLARTRYRVIKESKDYSLLEIDLLTGKKNQIRVHLSERGYPILGDLKYNENPQGRLALHALSIKFKHPFNEEEMVFETKIPDYFSNCIEVQDKDGDLPRKTKPFKVPKRASKKEKKTGIKTKTKQGERTKRRGHTSSDALPKGVNRL